MLSAIDQSGKMPSVWRSPGTSATGAATVTPALRAEAAAKTSSSSRVWPWPARPARPTISPSCATSSAPPACAGGPGLHHHRPAGARRASGRPARGRQRRPWWRPAGRGRSWRRRRWRPPLPSRITTMRSAVPRISPSRCEIRMQLRPLVDAARARRRGAGWRACASSDEVGSSRMTRLQRRVGDGEGARHLDHLPPADRAGRRPRRSESMPWPGKMRVEHVADQRRGPPRPAEAAAAASG